MAAGLSAALRALMSISRVIADCIATQRAITSAGASFPRSIAILLSITHRGGGRELSWAAFWSRLHQKVFEFEQFTQVVNCLISILLVADSLKPMMDLAPGRRPTDLHCFINEGARVGKRGEAPWLWLVFDQEWRFDTKIVHENLHRSVAPRTFDKTARALNAFRRIAKGTSVVSSIRGGAGVADDEGGTARNPRFS